MSRQPEANDQAARELEEDGARLKKLLKAEGPRNVRTNTGAHEEVCPFCGTPLPDADERARRCCVACYKIIHDPD